MTVSQYFVERGERRFGPFSAAQLRQLALESKIKPTDLIVDSASGKKSPAARVKGLTPAETAPAKPVTAPCKNCQQPLRQVRRKGVLTGERFCVACDAKPGICPICNKSLRTPSAQQCMNCGRSWHIETARSRFLNSPRPDKKTQSADSEGDAKERASGDPRRSIYGKRSELATPLALLFGIIISWGAFMKAKTLLGGLAAGFAGGIGSAIVLQILLSFPWLLSGMMIGAVCGGMISGGDATAVNIAAGIGALCGLCIEGITFACSEQDWISTTELVASIIPRLCYAFLLVAIGAPCLFLGIPISAQEYWKAWGRVLNLA